MIDIIKKITKHKSKPEITECVNKIEVMYEKECGTMKRFCIHISGNTSKEGAYQKIFDTLSST